MRRVSFLPLAFALTALLLASGCGSSAETEMVTFAKAANATTADAAATPGITVLGYGEAAYAADSAVVRPFLGRSSSPSLSFNSNGLEPEIFSAEAVSQVVHALGDAVVPSETIRTNPFARNPYISLLGGLEVVFTWPQPGGVEQMLAAVQKSLGGIRTYGSNSCRWSSP